MKIKWILRKRCLTCSVEKLKIIYKFLHIRLARSGLFLYRIKDEHDNQISEEGGAGSV